MSIKPILWIVGGLLALILLGSAAYVFFFAASPEPVTPGDVTLPGSGPVSTTTATTGGEVDTLELPASGGGSVVVKDFINNGSTIPDTANPGRYLLAGDLGYCPEGSNACKAAPAENFLVYYNSDEQSFTIALTDEPLGEARRAAERFMEETLGITKPQLCQLVYYVGVDSYTNEQYAGKNLGFSFCPGATKLPQ